MNGRKRIWKSLSRQRGNDFSSGKDERDELVETEEELCEVPELPEGKDVLSSPSVYDVNTANGNVARFKARFAAR